MKFILLSALILSASAASFEITEYNISEQLSIKSDPEGPYDRCIEILEKILAEAGEISKYIINKEWDKVLPLAIFLAKNIYEDIQCFRDPKITVIQDLINAFESNPAECVIKILNHIVEHARKLVQAVINQDLEEIKKQVKCIIHHIQEIKKCFE